MNFLATFIAVASFAGVPIQNELMDADAGYTVTWTAPVENTDGSPLTDLDHFELWCLFAFEADGVTPRTYGNPAIISKEDTQYVKDWAGPGDWKCRMKAVNEQGTKSDPSTEVFFTLLDPDGDGNGHIDPGGVITLVVPGFPDVVMTCPEVATGGCRSNSLIITRKGYWVISGPDGELLLKPDGSTRQVTSRDEAYEYVTLDGRTGKFIILPPTYEVEWQ